VAAWRFALESRRQPPHGNPVALSLTRQKLPVLEGTVEDPESGIAKGGYVISEERQSLKMLLIGTGSEVEVCVCVARELEKKGIGARVVSMPCRELFLSQDKTYRDQILPPHISHRVVVEAAVSQGWEAILGPEGRFFGLSDFGASAPYQDLARHFGFTPENILAEITKKSR
jgi:transketolase